MMNFITSERERLRNKKFKLVCIVRADILSFPTHKGYFPEGTRKRLISGET